MTFALALTAAILGGLSLVLHVVAPKTKTQLDDKVVDLIDKALEKLK